MIKAGDSSLGLWVDSLIERQPTPGGGAAAAAVAAIGSAAAAMAANYTTGKRWADRSEEATALAADLAAVARACIVLADADQQAYLDLQETWRNSDMPAEEQQRRRDKARALPVSLIKTCLAAAERCSGFMPRCNPQIRSDLKVGLHLLAGAARAAWQTFLVNKPSELERQELQSRLDRIAALEADVLSEP